MHSRLSSKGHVTIPKKIRDSLGLEPGDFVTYELAEDDAGLPLPCLVRLMLFTLDNRVILRRIGRLGGADKKRVESSLAQHLP